MEDADAFRRGLDTLLDQHADDIGFLEIEQILQARAQDMRECAYQEGSADIITADDLDGWTDE